MNAGVRALKSRRAVGVTIFRAGFICVAGVIGVYLYLMAVASSSAALLGAGLSLVIPILCFAIGFAEYVFAVNQLKAQGIPSRGIMRRQGKEDSLTDDQEDIWRHLASQFDE